jgi:group I intron endonuclease
MPTRPPSNTGFVYKWVNLINGKWYLGSHNGSYKDYKGSGVLFIRAYKKYGIGSFKRFILYTGPDFREEEDRLLKLWNAANDPLSYNLRDEAVGNYDGSGFSDDWKEKISKSNKNNPLLKKPKSKEHIKKVAEATRRAHKEGRINFKGKNNPFYGKTHSMEIIEASRAKNKELWKDPEYRARMTAINQRNMTEEVKRKISETKKRAPLSEEQREALREAGRKGAAKRWGAKA